MHTGPRRRTLLRRHGIIDSARPRVDPTAAGPGSLYSSAYFQQRVASGGAPVPGISFPGHDCPGARLLRRKYRGHRSQGGRGVHALGARRYGCRQDLGQLRRQPVARRAGTRAGFRASAVAGRTRAPLRGRSRRHEHFLPYRRQGSHAVAGGHDPTGCYPRQCHRADGGCRRPGGGTAHRDRRGC